MELNGYVGDTDIYLLHLEPAFHTEKLTACYKLGGGGNPALSDNIHQIDRERAVNK